MQASRFPDKTLLLRTRNLALSCTVLLAFTGSSLLAQAPAKATSDLLDAFVREAFEKNPRLMAQSSRVEAARQRIPQAGALPDPVADLRFTNLSLSNFSMKDALTSGIELGVVQTLPGPGKRKLAREVAGGEMAVEEERLLALQRTLRRDVLQSVYSYGVASKLLEINTVTMGAQQVVIEAAISNYSTGGASQADVLMAQSALTRSQRDRQDLLTQRSIGLARLGNLLARPVTEEEMAGVEMPEPVALPPFASLLPLLETTSAEVLRAQAEFAVADSRVAVAKKASSPDFMVGGGYRYKDMSMGGTNYLTATVGVTLPFFHRSDRYLPAQNEALALKQGALEDKRSALEEARFELSEAYQRAARNINVYGLYKDGLMIQASQAYDAALTAYGTGRADLNAVQGALATLYTTQAEEAMAQGEYHQNVAAMEALLGRPLHEISSSRDAPSTPPDPAPSTPYGKE